MILCACIFRHVFIAIEGNIASYYVWLADSAHSCIAYSKWVLEKDYSFEQIRDPWKFTFPGVIYTTNPCAGQNSRPHCSGGRKTNDVSARVCKKESWRNTWILIDDHLHKKAALKIMCLMISVAKHLDIYFSLTELLILWYRTYVNVKSRITKCRIKLLVSISTNNWRKLCKGVW